ncbi:hypothetical protein PROFUN_15905, partial [Planoprotostelium fungivorum]
VLDLIMGLRLRDEELGLDVKDHGETAYGWQHYHQQQHEVLLNVDGQVLDTNETTRVLVAAASSVLSLSRSQSRENLLSSYGTMNERRSRQPSVIGLDLPSSVLPYLTNFLLFYVYSLAWIIHDVSASFDRRHEARAGQSED